MPEITEQQREEIRETALNVALEKNGMSDLFKPQSEYEQHSGYIAGIDPVNPVGASSSIGNESPIPGPLMDDPHPKPRKKRETKVPVPAAKPQSTNALIEKLKEQIVVIGYIDGIRVGDIPTPLSKENRDRLIAMGKEVENIKIKYINQVQK